MPLRSALSVLLCSLASLAADGGSEGSARVEGGEVSEFAVADAGTVMPGLVPPLPVPAREKNPPITSLKPLSPKADVLARARRGADGRLYARHASGASLPLTIEPGLQTSLEEILARYETPMAAVVVLEPSTGRVLAMSEYAHGKPSLRGLSTRAVYPAASIFKIVSASALLRAGLDGERGECFHGGLHGLTERLLEDSPRDNQCLSLTQAMGRSANVVFAKLTRAHLSPQTLREEAARYRFNRPIDFPVPTDVSLAAIPEEPFPFAETGAGFGDVYLSPLHGALIASVAANGGLWREPVLLEGHPTPDPERILTEEQAEALTEMLEETVSGGTARRVFRERGFKVEGAVGKTGTLADKQPFRDYSWFVGFAPRDRPRVAVAAVIVNEPRWRIRATWLGREAMRLALKELPPLEAPTPEVLASPVEPPAPLEAPLTAAPDADADEASDRGGGAVEGEALEPPTSSLVQ